MVIAAHAFHYFGNSQPPPPRKSDFRVLTQSEPSHTKFIIKDSAQKHI